MLSVIIPAKNEPYLQQTIDSVLSNAWGFIEVIVILDGCEAEITPHPKLKVMHFKESVGMRSAINYATIMAKGEYLMKLDAHCMVAPGFDIEVTNVCEDNTIIVPRRYRLDVENWKIIEDGRPPIDRMYLSPDLHGKEWKGGEGELQESPSSQGSCWVMKKTYYKELELLDQETYGTFFSEFQEIGLKCWLSGGKVLVTTKTWYAHWHKKVRGYSLPKDDKEKAQKAVERWREGNAWYKQKYPLSFFDRFNMPGWTPQ